MYEKNYMNLVSEINLLESNWMRYSIFCNPTMLVDKIENDILPPKHLLLSFYLLSGLLVNNYFEDIYFQRLIYLKYVRNWIYDCKIFYFWYRNNENETNTFFCHDFFTGGLLYKCINIIDTIDKKKICNEGIKEYWKRKKAMKIIDRFLFEKFIPYIYNPSHPYCEKLLLKEYSFINNK